MRLEEVRDFSTKVLGIHGPQWMIVMALQRLDRGEGATLQAIADLLQVNPTFVTSNSRLLERKGLVRAIARDDGAIVMLSLTGQARQHLAELASLQKG
jgi:DNA-binding MarR family transcriptional regulator